MNLRGWWEPNRDSRSYLYRQARQEKQERESTRNGRDIAPVLFYGHQRRAAMAELALIPDRSILGAMKIAIGKVVGGKVVLEGVTLEEGASVTVLARDEKGGVTLTPDEESELLLAIAEADRGETVSAEEVLARLARRHG